MVSIVSLFSLKNLIQHVAARSRVPEGVFWRRVETTAANAPTTAQPTRLRSASIRAD